MLASHKPQKKVWGLSLKSVQIDTIDKKNSFGFCGVQNCQAGRYRRVPFMAPIKGGVRHEAEQLILREQRTGGR
jgi:hypothetical protein